MAEVLFVCICGASALGVDPLHNRSRPDVLFERWKGVLPSAGIPHRQQAKALGGNANSRHSTRFSGYFDTAESVVGQRQETQIVQSELNLHDFLP